MNHWLVKSEPIKYSFQNLMRDKKTVWDGVRNYQARNHLRAMKVGDAVLFYHSNEDKAVIGVAEVVKEFYPDPTASDGDWSVVELKSVEPLATPVTLATIKATPELKDIALIKQSRLSVMPVNKNDFKKITKLGGLK